MSNQQLSAEAGQLHCGLNFHDVVRQLESSKTTLKYYQGVVS
jgi:hypothetical protein